MSTDKNSPLPGTGQTFNVYCEESCHLPYDRASEMLLGAMLVPRERVSSLTLQLRERLAGLGWPRTKNGGWAELKWTKVSPAGLQFYDAALDFFFSQNDLFFHALIAPKSQPTMKQPKPPTASIKPGSKEWEEYHSVLEKTAGAVVDHLQCHDAWYYDRYFDLLRYALLPPAKHFIFLDVKDTRGGARIRTLKSRLDQAHLTSPEGVVQGIWQIHSEEVLLDQVVDLLLGCLAWTRAKTQHNKGHRPSPAKLTLAQKFQSKLSQLEGSRVPKVVIHDSADRSPQHEFVITTYFDRGRPG